MGNTTNEDNSHLAAEANERAQKAQAASQERMQKAKLAHEKRMKELENANKEKQRERIDAGIKELQSTMQTVENSVRGAKNDLVNEEQRRAHHKAEKELLMKTIDNFGKYKKEQLQNYEIEIKLDIARTNYFKDRDEIENAITRTGVHSDDIDKFLKLTHAMTGATMSTQAQANRLDVALNTFGTIINNECQDKLTIDYYFTERNLKEFIPILAKEGYETLDHMICDDEKQFKQDILITLDKGTQKQENKLKEDATNKIKQYLEMEQEQKQQLTEIENKLREFDNKTETKEKENDKQKLIGEQSEINNKITIYQRMLKEQKDILQDLEDKEKKREEQKLEQEGEEEKCLETDKEGEELCIYLLEQWKLKQYWDQLEEEGWDDPDDWDHKDLDLENDIGITKKGHRNKFMKKVKQWKDMQLDKNKPKQKQKLFYYIKLIQQRELKNICLRSKQTWIEYEKEKAQIIKQDLLSLCPVLSDFFGRMNEGVKQTEELLNLNNKLSDAQLKAIEMRKENNKKLKAIELRRKDHDGRRLLVNNSQCEIYSDSSKQWCEGKVINIKEDIEGTWLTIEYKVNNELRRKDVQRYNKDIRPLQRTEEKEEKEELIDDDQKEKDDLSVAKKNSNPIVIQSGALITASIVNINVTDSLMEQFAASPVTERGLTLAVSVEDCCRHIIKNQGSIRRSVFLAQEILKYKPANMTDNRTMELWKAVDTGIIRIFTSAVEMVRAAAEYFGFFLRFQNSFKFFISCYHNGKDASLFISLERLKKDLRAFNQFRQNFSNTVLELNRTAMECIGNCVKQQIGHLNWEKSRQSIQQTEKIYLTKKKLHDQQALELDNQLNKLEEKKVLEISNEARSTEQCNMLNARITQGDAYFKQCRQQMNDLQKIVI